MKKWKNFMAAVLVFVMTAVLAFPATEVEAASAPKKAKITYLKSQSAGKVTVKYSKVKGAKYQIQVATNSKFCCIWRRAITNIFSAPAKTITTAGK